jgi:hypothetical protein
MEIAAMHGVIGRRDERVFRDRSSLLVVLGAALMPVILAVLIAFLRRGSAASVADVIDVLSAAAKTPM